eukprot:gnl/Trimastix_PCT/1961.p1 GENE.gnl/Trimastix_PCT/1961~~gnl/Trimastix_PCT/1961.p1  ORF type:complete len:437 (-),score=124.99 gnl/Trimastix_PCT/1961:248-1558(-)
MEKRLESLQTQFQVKGTLYTYEAALFLRENAHLKASDYIRKCREENKPRVALVHRKEVLAFINEEIANIRFIEPTSAEDTAKSTEPSKPTAVEDIVLDAELQKSKEQLAQHLDTSTSRAAIAIVPEQMPALGAMSRDKIAELRAKRLARKRQTIKDVDASDEQPVEKKGGRYVELDAVVTATIRKQERTLQDRTSVLQSRKKNFKSCLQLLRTAQEREQREQHERAARHHAHAHRNDPRRASGSQPHKHAANTQHAHPTLPIKRTHGGRQASAAFVPIIIVPAALTSLLTLYNVDDFLQNGTFIPPLEKKARMPQKPEKVSIHRVRPSGATVQYEIIDNHSKLRKHDWQRVVAVFATGKLWQFKGWPWKEPVDIFHNVKGFHLRYDDQAEEPLISKWDVKVLTVMRSQRHLDQPKVLEFWRALEEWLAVRRPGVLP